MSGGSVLDRLQALDARLAPRSRDPQRRSSVLWIVVAIRIVSGAVWIVLGSHEHGWVRGLNLAAGVAWLLLGVSSAVSQLRRRRTTPLAPLS